MGKSEEHQIYTSSANKFCLKKSKQEGPVSLNWVLAHKMAYNSGLWIEISFKDISIISSGGHVVQLS